MKVLRLGTRGSALARAQSEWVALKLRTLHPGLSVELVPIVTTGDASAAPPRGANVKASFVKELEDALSRGEVDLAVHSAKDLPALLPEGLTLAAIPEREDPRDVFIGAKVRRLDDLPRGALIGTSSLRRRSQLQLLRPDLRFAPMRGNVDTRLKKLEQGAAEALILAEAGLRRLGLDSVARELIPVDVVVPAPGQGALAVEARADREEVRALLAALDDEQARVEVALEREFLRAMGGGCSTPLGALARAESAGPTRGLRLTVFWEDSAGRSQRLSGSCGARPEEMSSLVEGLRSRLQTPA